MLQNRIEFLLKLTMDKSSGLSGLKDSKVAILTWQAKHVKPTWVWIWSCWNLKTSNCKHYWMRMTLKNNKYVWKPWKRSKRWKNGFNKKWMKDSRKTKKPVQKKIGRTLHQNNVIYYFYHPQKSFKY